MDAESAAIVGAEPDVGLMLKFTTFDTSVVVVAVVPDAPETADPGICTATFTLPAEVRSEFGTGAVSCALLTKVVVSWT